MIAQRGAFCDDLFEFRFAVEKHVGERHAAARVSGRGIVLQYDLVAFAEKPMSNGRAHVAGATNKNNLHN